MKKNYVARIFMVLTLLAVLIAMSGCGGGNAGNELTDEQLLEMLEERGLAPGIAEETEKIEYMPATTMDDASIQTEIAVDRTIGFDDIALNIPSTGWAYAYDNESIYLTIRGTAGDGTHIDMNLFPVYLDEWEFDEWFLDSSNSWDRFMFADGHLGYMMMFDDRIVWVHFLDSFRGGSQAHLWLNHDGDTSIFTDNENLITAIARTLTSSPPDYTETAPAQQDQVTEWITVDTGSVSIDIPSTWSYEWCPSGAMDIFSDDGTIHIVLGYIIAGNPHEFIEQTPRQVFRFDSGSEGYMFEDYRSIMWITDYSLCCGVLFFHDGYHDVFTDPEELILRIARSLRGS